MRERKENQLEKVSPLHFKKHHLKRDTYRMTVLPDGDYMMITNPPGTDGIDIAVVDSTTFEVKQEKTIKCHHDSFLFSVPEKNQIIVCNGICCIVLDAASLEKVKEESVSTTIKKQLFIAGKTFFIDTAYSGAGETFKFCIINNDLEEIFTFEIPDILKKESYSKTIWNVLPNGKVFAITKESEKKMLYVWQIEADGKPVLDKTMEIPFKESYLNKAYPVSEHHIALATEDEYYRPYLHNSYVFDFVKNEMITFPRGARCITVSGDGNTFLFNHGQCDSFQLYDKHNKQFYELILTDLPSYLNDLYQTVIHKDIHRIRYCSKQNEFRLFYRLDVLSIKLPEKLEYKKEKNPIAEATNLFVPLAEIVEQYCYGRFFVKFAYHHERLKAKLIAQSIDNAGCDIVVKKEKTRKLKSKS